MIIVGYPCIGKSTYAVGHPYRAIDLESSNFVKDDNWVKSYCNVAIDLSRQGHVVFVSSHDAVRKQLLKSNYECIFAIYPALDIKDEWIERLRNRYLNTELEKDYRAWQRALNHYDEDIAKLKEDAKNFSGFYEIGHGRYDLSVILDEFDYGSTWDHSQLLIEFNGWVGGINNMNVIKHGTHRTKDSEKLYKITCDSCGCVFEAKRSEFHVWPLPARPISETVKNYDNTGRPAEIQCPECKCTCGIRMRLLARESAFLHAYCR